MTTPSESADNVTEACLNVVFIRYQNREMKAQASGGTQVSLCPLSCSVGLWSPPCAPTLGVPFREVALNLPESSLGWRFCCRATFISTCIFCPIAS